MVQIINNGKLKHGKYFNFSIGYIFISLRIRAANPSHTNPDNGPHLKGIIDEVIIYNSPLTQAEVKILYECNQLLYLLPNLSKKFHQP